MNVSCIMHHASNIGRLYAFKSQRKTLGALSFSLWQKRAGVGTSWASGLESNLSARLRSSWLGALSTILSPCTTSTPSSTLRLQSGSLSTRRPEKIFTSIVVKARRELKARQDSKNWLWRLGWRSGGVVSTPETWDKNWNNNLYFFYQLSLFRKYLVFPDLLTVTSFSRIFLRVMSCL